jgi:DNA polymerase III subunit delta'
MRLGDIVGHGGLPRLIARLIARGRLPHAMILEGLAGCGRRTFARSMAKSLLCGAAQQGDSCGACASCQVMAAGTHPDCIELPHESSGADLPLDVVRDVVVDAVFTSPLMGATKVFILPGIERLTPAAANTLLKVLEEPPRGTYLIMTTTTAAGVLKTIRSRAQLYRLSPLSGSDVVTILVRRGMAREEAQRLSLVAQGSLHGLEERNAEIPFAALSRLLDGHLDESLVGDVISQLPKRVSEDAGDRTLAAEQRRTLGLWLEALVQRERAFLAGPTAEQVSERIERVLRLQQDLERHLNPHLIVEGLALPTR